MSKQKLDIRAISLFGNLALGSHNFQLSTARIISSNAIQNLTEAGMVDGNTAGPKLERVNGATDKALRLTWAAAEENEIQFSPWFLPPDLDPDAPVTIRLLLGKSANANTVTLAVGVFAGVGDTNAGGNTATIAQALATYDVVIAAADVPVHPTMLNVCLTPSAHAGDVLYLYGAQAIYTRKA